MLRHFYSAAYGRLVQKLKDARLEAGMSQREASKKLRQGPTYINKIEARQRRVDFLEVQELARLYKKPLSYFED